MRKISSHLTFYYKRIFPAFWFGFLAIWTFIAIPGVINGKAPFFIIIFPFIMAAFGYFLMRVLVFCLVDEAYINEDQIFIKNKSKEVTFPISDILNVDCTMMTNPERITLTLKNPTELGSEISFSPSMRWFPFFRHPIATELIQKANAG